MKEPTRAEVRQAGATIARELEEIGRLIDEKIASGQLSASRSGRKALQEARVAVRQLVDRIGAEFRLQDALEDVEASAPAPDADRAPGWKQRN